MDTTKKWFRRLAEVPGLKYQGNPNIKREQLPGYNSTPKIQNNSYSGFQQLVWAEKNGVEKWQSPAKEWQTANQSSQKDAKPLALLKTLYETLELPGELSDYHFAIQSCYEELWKYRRKEPWLVKEVERLCWLDIQLIEAHPDTLSFGFGGEQNYFGVLAFQRLIEIYEREGYLYEAYDVAQRATRFNQQQPALERLKAKLIQLQSEENVTL